MERGREYGGATGLRIGVLGESGAGTGVHGVSQSGRGGVFASTNMAQLQLVAAVNPKHALPSMGVFGDLYVKVTGGFEKGLIVKMYLCVVAGDGPPDDISLMWAPFQFGPAEQGGP